MIRKLMTAAALALAAPAAAETWTLPADQPLETTRAGLAALPAPTAAERYGLAAVTFLRGIEQTLQSRYRSFQIKDAGVQEMFPVMRLPVPPNPNAEPLRPEVLTGLFSRLLEDMAQTRAALDAAAPGPGDIVVIDLAALWFDIDGDGARGPGETLLDAFAAAAGGAAGPGASAPPPGTKLTVHFDAADAQWLAAYTHLLSAVSEFVLAFDPAEAIGEVMASAAALEELRGSSGPPVNYGFDIEAIADQLAVVLNALQRKPGTPHIHAMRDHLLAMIARNRDFWRLVAQETDDTREWIPNDRQTAALGFELPPQTGEAWLRVLADAEAVLEGRLLVYHWRVSPAAGVNVAKLLDDPPEVDPVRWIQGAGLLPYMERGPLVTAESLARFSAMFRGDALLFMVLLN